MARRGENIYKRRDGRYEGRYVLGKKPNGKTWFGYVYGRQYGEVRRLLLIKKATLLQQNAEFSPQCHQTLREWAAEWLTARLHGGMKLSTHQTYDGLLSRYILPELGDCMLGVITPELIRAMLSRMETQGFAQSTILVTFRLLSGILNAAQEAGKIGKNPCKHIKMHALAPVEQRVLSVDEQRSLINSAQKIHDLPALFSLYTGMRLGEICALRWSDVDWSRSSVTVRRTVQRIRSEESEFAGRTHLHVDAPKSSSSIRTIPVPAFLMDMLQSMRESAPLDSYIFGSEQPAEPRTLQRRFTDLAERAGLKGVHFHTLRHSFATRMLELGIDVKTISKLLGHSTVQTTLNCYAHSLLESQRQAIDRLAFEMR